MKKHVRVSLLSFLILICVATVGCSNAKKEAKEVKNIEKISDIDLSKYFTGYEGSFVLFDKNKSEYTIYNQTKSQKQVSPCSTFKIINSLIGLETKVLKDENTIFKWDGTKRQIESTNKDQTLKSAVSNSVVWYFEKVASQVGEKKLQDYLNKYNYGNKDISGGLTSFWL